MGLFSSIGSVLGGVAGNIIAPGIGGSIGSAIGGTIGSGIEAGQAGSAADEASTAAAAARRRANKSSKEGVEVAQQFLAEWESIYGGIEDNLSSFFASLTPERFTALGLENFQQEFQVTQERINQSFAQRGIPDSGLEISLDTLLEAKRAEVRAGIRTEAPFKVAEAQSKFLALGLPFKRPTQVGVSSAIESRTNTLLGFASASTEAAAAAATGAGIVEGEFAANISGLADVFGGIFGGGGSQEDFGRTPSSTIPIPGRKPINL